MNALQETAARSSLVKVARWGVNHEPQIHYTEDARRSGWLHRPPYALPMWTDCSGFVTYCYWVAGLPDPNGLGYRDVGYTGTLLAHCEHIGGHQARPGDIIVYGPGTGHHAVIVTGFDQQAGSVAVVSHGWEGGPQVSTNLQQESGQPRPTTWLRNPCFSGGAQ